MPTLTADPELRQCLLDFFIDSATGQDLSEWLRDIGLDPKGSVADKQNRIRQNTRYLSMPSDDFPAQTEIYLKPFTSDDLADICEVLGLRVEGTRDARYRRIMREVRFREGWVAKPNGGGVDCAPREAIC
jgi:hypothetical protein